MPLLDQVKIPQLRKKSLGAHLNLPCCIYQAICKSRNGESGNGMRGMRGMLGIRVGMTGMR